MSRSPYGGAALAVVAMLCVQLGLAVSVGLIDRVGVTGAAWLRLAWAGVLFLVFVRPRRGAFTRRTFAACVALGVVTALISVLFMGQCPVGWWTSDRRGVTRSDQRVVLKVRRFGVVRLPVSRLSAWRR